MASTTDFVRMDSVEMRTRTGGGLAPIIFARMPYGDFLLAPVTGLSALAV
jgi:hypothetical protein